MKSMKAKREDAKNNAEINHKTWSYFSCARLRAMHVTNFLRTNFMKIKTSKIGNVQYGTLYVTMEPSAATKDILQ